MGNHQNAILLSKTLQKGIQMNQQPIIAYKGFNADLTCRDFHFQIGETYTHKGKVKACASGFHACENPLDVFNYYNPTSRFAIVECSGEISKASDGDSKIACGSIHIKAEIGLPTLISKSVDFILSKIKWDAAKESNTGNQSAATNTGYCSAAEVTGAHSVAAALGHSSKAKAGENGAIVCVYRNDDCELIHIRASKVGDNGIEAGKWYTLDENGEFIEAN